MKEANNTFVGEGAGELAITNTNCTFIGLNAGADITEGDGITIIGDNIRSLDKNQSNVVFLGDKVAISKDVWKVLFTLPEIVTGDDSTRSVINTGLGRMAGLDTTTGN